MENIWVLLYFWNWRSSRRRSSIKKTFLKISEKFTRPLLYPRLLINKVAIIKKETSTQMFSFEFCETFKKTYFEEHLQATASGIIPDDLWVNLFYQSKRGIRNKLSGMFWRITLSCIPKISGEKVVKP